MSTCNTPKKRRVMISWPSIVSKISANLKVDDIDYVDILENMEDIEIFQKTKLKTKKNLLQTEFGDESSDLIGEILELLDHVSLKSVL